MTFVYDQDYGYCQDGKSQSPARRRYFELAFGTESVVYVFPIVSSDTGFGADTSITSFPVASSDSGSGADASLPLVTLISGTEFGTGADFGTLQTASIVSSDSGIGTDVGLAVLTKKDSDSGSGTDTQGLGVSSFDQAGMIEGLLSEWGVSWGAIDLDLQALGVLVSQSVVGEAELVLLAEEENST